jgi:hypothetical protein
MANHNHESSLVFRAALARFEAGLTREQKQRFRGCTLENVETAIDQIQQKHGARRQARNMGKMKAFLEAMTHIGRVFEVFFKRL